MALSAPCRAQILLTWSPTLGYLKLNFDGGVVGFQVNLVLGELLEITQLLAFYPFQSVLFLDAGVDGLDLMDQVSNQAFTYLD